MFTKHTLNQKTKVIEVSSYQSYDDIIFINTTINRGIKSANIAQSNANSYSSDDYEFFSDGGGRGSFGGSSRGGGGFR